MARVPDVLVIDQDPAARFEIKRLLRGASLGFAGEAALGTEAVSLAAEKTPDVIICGLSQPPERSLQTIEALLDVLPETPVIAYGKNEDVEAVRRAMQAGARDFLILPADTEKLVESVRNVLESEERKRLRMSGQAAGLGPKGLVVAVFGAKGGVGKTTVATNVSLALAAEMGQSVVLVDGDNSFGDVAAMLELRPERTIMDILRDREKIDRSNVEEYLVQHASGLWVLPAPRESLHWRSVTPDAFRSVVDLLARRFDLVFVDTAAVLSDMSMAILEEANMVLWVTSTDFSSINNSLQGLDALQQMSYPNDRIRLVLNVNSPDDNVRPAKIEEVLKREFFWSIPYDKQVRMGAQVGKPAVIASPDSAGAKALFQLAEAVTGASRTEPQKSTKKGGGWLFRRKEQNVTEPAVAEGG
jgi:pilus assembly protein CpaE